MLGSPLPANDQRQDYLRASLTIRADGVLVATPNPIQDSSMLRVLAKAECLVIRGPNATADAAGAPLPRAAARPGLVGLGVRHKVSRETGRAEAGEILAGMVRRACQRRGRDDQEALGQGEALEGCELVRRYEPDDGVMLFGRLEILADGEEIDVGAA